VWNKWYGYRTKESAGGGRQRETTSGVLNKPTGIRGEENNKHILNDKMNRRNK
jgi:hypothetical protein